MTLEAVRQHIDTLGASGKRTLFSVDLENSRSLFITAKVKYNASATAPLKVNVYYSPDEKNTDTVPYATFNITLTAGSTVQRTCQISPPEEGDLSIEVENSDTSYTATDISVWYRVSNWSFITTGPG